MRSTNRHVAFGASPASSRPIARNTGGDARCAACRRACRGTNAGSCRRAAPSCPPICRRTSRLRARPTSTCAIARRISVAAAPTSLLAALERRARVAPRFVDQRARRAIRRLRLSRTALGSSRWSPSVPGAAGLRALTFGDSSSSTRRPMPHAQPEWHIAAKPMMPMRYRLPPRSGVLDRREVRVRLGHEHVVDRVVDAARRAQADHVPVVDELALLDGQHEDARLVRALDEAERVDVRAVLDARREAPRAAQVGSRLASAPRCRAACPAPR